VAARSIYAANPAEIEGGNLKSHAPTPEYLADEVTRRLGDAAPQGHVPVIWLVRDPRDAMISFYEYSRHRLGMELDQTRFCTDFDWFLAAPIDRTCERRTLQSPLTVMEAYRLHLARWQQEHAAGRVLLVRYEELLVRTEEVFAAIAGALGLPAPNRLKGIEEKVSQYSDDGRARGTSETWKQHRETYAEIIARVEAALGPEMECLGYLVSPGEAKPWRWLPRLGRRD
jgi:hypothetical protein